MARRAGKTTRVLRSSVAGGPRNRRTTGWYRVSTPSGTLPARSAAKRQPKRRLLLRQLEAVVGQRLLEHGNGGGRPVVARGEGRGDRDRGIRALIVGAPN